ncbi:DUF6059 family protein [Streptomyces sp. NPDC004838]
MWRELAWGLAAVGQYFGACTTPECYGFATTYHQDESGTATGHPESLVPVPELSARERAVLRRLEALWESPGPSAPDLQARSLRPGP